jgi:hypothetical protein
MKFCQVLVSDAFGFPALDQEIGRLQKPLALMPFG